jgi:hypothetical protein
MPDPTPQQSTPAFAPADPPGSYRESNFAAQGSDSYAQMIDASSNQFFDPFFASFFE